MYRSNEDCGQNQGRGELNLWNGSPGEEPAESSRRKRKVLSFLASVGLHAAVVCAVLLLPPLIDREFEERPKPRGRRLEDITAIKQPRVIWLQRYQPQAPMVEVSPQKGKTESSALQEGQLLVKANPPEAKHDDQFVYVPVPKVAEQQRQLPSPNVVLAAEQTPTEPRQPAPKPFKPPEPLPKQVQELQLGEPPPGVPIQADPLRAANLQVSSGQIDATKPAP